MNSAQLKGKPVNIPDVCVFHSYSKRWTRTEKEFWRCEDVLCVSAWQSTVDKLKNFAYHGSRLHLNSLKGIGNRKNSSKIRRVNAFRFCVRSFAIAQLRVCRRYQVESDQQQLTHDHFSFFQLLISLKDWNLRYFRKNLSRVFHLPVRDFYKAQNLFEIARIKAENAKGTK